jgi:hypothetical protein
MAGDGAEKPTPPAHFLCLKVQIPRTAVSRREMTYAQLLKRVHLDRHLNVFEGPIMKTGISIDQSELWPSSDFPACPLLLEFAGSDRKGRGHNRSSQIHILWRYEPEGGGWVEIVRTLSVGAEWIMHLAPIALRELGGRPPVDELRAGAVARFFLSQLDKDLCELGAGEKASVLTQLFEQLAARLVSAAA